MEIGEIELNDFLEAVHTRYGYDFTDYAPASVKRRIVHFMGGTRFSSLEVLKKQLLEDEHFFEQFVREISVTVTEMFRDPTYYKSLRDNVMKRLATYPVIKIWVAGCATGEEAYSMAIMLKEENLLHRSIIYATDINQRSLGIAKNATYPLEYMKLYTSNYIQAGGTQAFSEYYTAKYDSALFDKSLQMHIVFSPHNLVTDRMFNEFQLITCRNVLIYFNQALQNKVINLFYESLCPFGFMGLGNRESLLFTDKKDCFEETDKNERIFMKYK